MVAHDLSEVIPKYRLKDLGDGWAGICNRHGGRQLNTEGGFSCQLNLLEGEHKILCSLIGADSQTCGTELVFV